MSGPRTVSQIVENRLVAILRQPTARAAIDVGSALVAAGVRVIEVAYTTPEAGRVLRELEQATDDDTILGAGTILTTAELDDAVSSGARFVFTPHIDADLLATAADRDVVAVPGVMTPTDVATALAAGVELAKLFPAATLGPGHLRALRGPFPQLRAIPTGGVTVENAGAWITAGAAAVGVSSAFERAWGAGGSAAVEQTARALLAALADAPGA